jgi:hypothetical protein
MHCWRALEILSQVNFCVLLFDLCTDVHVLDIEGTNATKNALPTDKADEMGNAQNTQKRVEVVKELPRLCYAITDVIVFVTRGGYPMFTIITTFTNDH